MSEHTADYDAACQQACAYGECSAPGSYQGCGGCCGCLGGCQVAYEATLPPVPENDLPGTWSYSDFLGGPPDEVRGPDWTRVIPPAMDHGGDS